MVSVCLRQFSCCQSRIDIVILVTWLCFRSFSSLPVYWKFYYIPYFLQRYLGLVTGSMKGSYNGSHITCSYGHQPQIDPQNPESSYVSNLTSAHYVIFARGSADGAGKTFTSIQMPLFNCSVLCMLCFVYELSILAVNKNLVLRIIPINIQISTWKQCFWAGNHTIQSYCH